MRTLVLLLIFSSTNVSAQLYGRFASFSAGELTKHKTEIPANYYSNLADLINRRDTTYLNKRLSETSANWMCIVEGFNFETNKYCLYEEYKIDTSIFARSLVYVNKVLTKNIFSYFFADRFSLKENSSSVDTIYPRKYRYGAGDNITKAVQNSITETMAKAEKEGIVIEKYCRITTYIDKINNKIVTTFSFPVEGNREYKIYIGWGTPLWPMGLGFWLFDYPLALDN